MELGQFGSQQLSRVSPPYLDLKIPPERVRGGGFSIALFGWGEELGHGHLKGEGKEPRPWPVRCLVEY